MAKVTLSEGEKINVEFEGTDGIVTVGFGAPALTVHVDMADSAGREGCIYAEPFGHGERPLDDDGVEYDEARVAGDIEHMTARAEVRDWTTGFSHRVVAYGVEGPWVGYNGVSTVVTPYGEFGSLMDAATTTMRVVAFTSSETFLAPEPPRVLIVDDDRSICSVVERQFARSKQFGQATACTDPEQALDLLRQGLIGAVHLLIVDLHMPEMDGIEFIRRMCAITTPPKAFILFSGTPDWEADWCERIQALEEDLGIVLVTGEKPCDYMSTAQSVFGLRK